MSIVTVSSLSNPGTLFTPTLTFGGTATGMTYGTRNGVYIRIGSLIFYSINIVLTAKGSSTGTAIVSGLPVAASAAAYAAAAIYTDGLSSITGTVMALVAPSGAGVALYQSGAGSSSQLTNANFTNSSNIFLTGVYAVA